MIAMGIAACVLTLWLVWRMSDREARGWADRICDLSREQVDRECVRRGEWSRPVSTTARTADKRTKRNEA
jgi:hypothetical protein